MLSLWKFVAVLIAEILASAMSAWEGSVTRPESPALMDWARRPDEEKTSNRHAARAGTRIISPQGNAEAVSVLSACQGVNTQRGRSVTLKGVASLHLKRGMQVAPPLR